MQDLVSIRNTTKGKLPRLPFVEIKNEILGKKYELSIVFCSNGLSKKLNRIYRGKDRPTNVLSFSLEKTSGEIIIDLKKAQKESALFGEKFPNFVGYLFIHGLLHLKGLSHGRTMEAKEQKIRKMFDI